MNLGQGQIFPSPITPTLTVNRAIFGQPVIQQSTFGNNSTQTITLSLGATPTVGNLLFCGVYGKNGIIVTPPTGFTVGPPRPGNPVEEFPNTLFQKYAYFYRVVEAGDGKNYTFTWDFPDVEAFSLYEIDNVATMELAADGGGLNASVVSFYPWTPAAGDAPQLLLQLIATAGSSDPGVTANGWTLDNTSVGLFHCGASLHGSTGDGITGAPVVATTSEGGYVIFRFTGTGTTPNDPNYNFNDSSPSAVDGVNIKWTKDTNEPQNLSARVSPATSSTFGVIQLDSALNTAKFLNGAGAWTYPLGGVSGKTANYTAVVGDHGTLLTFNSSSAVTLTLPNANTLQSNFFAAIENRGSGTLTITPTTSTLDGASSLAVIQNQGCIVFGDGTNYFTMRGISGTSGGLSGTSSKTANYTSVSADNGKLLVMNGSSLTLTLPATPPFAAWAIFVQNINASDLTISRNGLNIDGAAANLTVKQSQGVSIWTDGTNYFSFRGLPVIPVTSAVANKFVSAIDATGLGTLTQATLAGDSDVTLTSPTAGQILGYNGSAWVNQASSVSLFQHFADVGSVSTTETDLYSDSIAGGTLSGNGNTIFARYAGTFANTTSAKRIRVYLAGTAIFDSGALTISAASDWDVAVTLVRESATVVRCSVAANLTGASTGEFANYARLTGLTLSSANILKITGTASGTGVANNDIVASLGVVWSPGSGSSSAVPAYISLGPDIPPTAPNTMDDEFSAGSLNAKWSWLNQGATTVAFSDDCAIFNLTGISGDNFRGIEQTAPSAPWKVRCKLYNVEGPFVNFFVFGIYARNSTSGKIMNIGFSFNSGQVATVDKWTSVTGFSGTVTSQAIGYVPLYLEIENDATNIIFRCSHSGATGTFRQIYTETLATFISSVDKVGLVSQSNSTNQFFPLFDWFRRIS